jgi:hypothetical protein
MDHEQQYKCHFVKCRKTLLKQIDKRHEAAGSGAEVSPSGGIIWCEPTGEG